MVKLNRIYTRTGDDGTTGLATGARVRKDDLRVECYGTVDEANSAVGVAITHCRGGLPGTIPADIEGVLTPIQHELFDLGADLSTPRVDGEKNRLRILPEQTQRLERHIDEFNENLRALTSFVLPGGSALAAALHVARTVVRRAERLAVALQAERGAEVSAEAIRYLNRLSDLLFVLARVANDNGRGDVLWKPGSTRGQS